MNLRAAKSLDRVAGQQMHTFGVDLVAAGQPLAVLSSNMLRSLARASAVASDIELATKAIFEEKLGQLRNTRALIETTMSSAAEARNLTARYRRGSSTFNRGKRFAVGAIDENIQQLARCAEAFRRAEEAHQKILTLF